MELKIRVSIFLYVVMCSFVHVHGLSINSTTFDENFEAAERAFLEKTSKNEDSNRHAVKPPLIFPSEPGQYKVLEINNASINNDTAIKILLSRVRQHHEDNGEGQENATTIKMTATPTTTPKPAHVEPTESDVKDVDENLKSEVEDIQKPEGSEEQVGLEELYHKQQTSNLQLNQVFAEDIETNGNSLRGGHIAAIFAGVFAFVAIIIYVGLISWRSYLEKRYGMREQLVTEDDYYNNNDIRHFAL